MTTHSTRCYGIFATILAAVLLVVPSSPARAASEVSGRNLAALFSDFVVVAPGASQTFTSTIERGKPKRILTLTVSLQYAFSWDIKLSARVNGAAMKGGDPSHAGAYLLTALDDPGLVGSTATFWLDLDEAEAAAPGQFRKKPLNVEVEVKNNGVASFTDLTVAVTTTARMEKK